MPSPSHGRLTASASSSSSSSDSHLCHHIRQYSVGSRCTRQRLFLLSVVMAMSIKTTAQNVPTSSALTMMNGSVVMASTTQHVETTSGLSATDDPTNTKTPSVLPMVTTTISMDMYNASTFSVTEETAVSGYSDQLRNTSDVSVTIAVGETSTVAASVSVQEAVNGTNVVVTTAVTAPSNATGVTTTDQAAGTSSMRNELSTEAATSVAVGRTEIMNTTVTIGKETNGTTIISEVNSTVFQASEISLNSTVVTTPTVATSNRTTFALTTAHEIGNLNETVPVENGSSFTVGYSTVAVGETSTVAANVSAEETANRTDVAVTTTATAPSNATGVAEYSHSSLGVVTVGINYTKSENNISTTHASFPPPSSNNWQSQIGLPIGLGIGAAVVWAVLSAIVICVVKCDRKTSSTKDADSVEANGLPKSSGSSKNRKSPTHGVDNIRIQQSPNDGRQSHDKNKPAKSRRHQRSSIHQLTQAYVENDNDHAQLQYPMSPTLMDNGQLSLASNDDQQHHQSTFIGGEPSVTAGIAPSAEIGDPLIVAKQPKRRTSSNVSNRRRDGRLRRPPSPDIDYEDSPTRFRRKPSPSPYDDEPLPSPPPIGYSNPALQQFDSTPHYYHHQSPSPQQQQQQSGIDPNRRILLMQYSIGESNTDFHDNQAFTYPVAR